MKHGSDTVFILRDEDRSLLFVLVRGVSPSQTFIELIEGLNALILERFSFFFFVIIYYLFIIIYYYYYLLLFIIIIIYYYLLLIIIYYDYLLL